MPLILINASSLGSEKDRKSFTISSEELTYFNLLNKVCNKLRLRTKSTRLYLKDGKELDGRNLHELSDGDVVLATDVKGWVNRPLSKSDDVDEGLRDSPFVEIVIIGATSIIEEDAKAQLKSTAKLDGVMYQK